MTHLPDFERFQAQAVQARSDHASFVPVYRQLTADTLTPVEAYSRLEDSECSFLFESVVGGERIGRFSFLGADPFLRIDAWGTEVRIIDGDREVRFTSADPLKELERLLGRYRSLDVPELPRFCGGAVGYAGYDVIRYAEHLPDAPTDDRQLPDLSFAFFDRMVIFDQIRKTILVICHASVNAPDLQAEYARVTRVVDSMVEQLETATDGFRMADVSIGGDPKIPFESNFERAEFEAAVETCREYISAGDIFQVVISQRLKVETRATALDIYRALRVVNPSPFMFMLKTPETRLIGSSPEIMVRVEDGEVTIRPLAGTRRRGATAAEDQRLADELLADEKERAEHVMLVDLARNDVGRVAEYGSIRLSDVMVVERYSHVMHITSNVYGQLQAGLTPLDALRAGLPAGTVSGAPKVRAMEIIDEVERHRRGPYGGAVGYIDFTGNMDTCIALRTLVMQEQTVYIQAGAGIVADSVPSSEYQETINKAMAMLRAIEVAEKQLHVASTD